MQKLFLVRFRYRTIVSSAS